MIVVDASVILDLLLGIEPRASTIAKVVAREAPNIAAPYLLDAEVAQVLRRLARAQSISPKRGREALLDFKALPIIRYPHLPLLDRVFELRNNFTAYDALYFALAERVNAPLYTCDAKSANAAGHRAEVMVVGAAG